MLQALYARSEMIRRCDRAAAVFCSRQAFGMWRIAVVLAGFDPIDLWTEITTGRRRPGATINERGVLNAMARIEQRYKRR